MSLILNLILLAAIITFFEIHYGFATPQGVIRPQRKKIYYLSNAGAVPYPVSVSVPSSHQVDDSFSDKNIIYVNPVCDNSDKNKETSYKFTSYMKDGPEDTYLTKLDGSSVMDEKSILPFIESSEKIPVKYEQSEFKVPATEMPGVYEMHETKKYTYHPESSGKKTVETIIKQEPYGYDYPILKEEVSKYIIPNKVPQSMLSAAENLVYSTDYNIPEEKNTCVCKNGEVVLYKDVSPVGRELPSNEEDQEPADAESPEEINEDVQVRNYVYGSQQSHKSGYKYNYYRPRRSVKSFPDYSKYLSARSGNPFSQSQVVYKPRYPYKLYGKNEYLGS